MVLEGRAAMDDLERLVRSMGSADAEDARLTLVAEAAVAMVAGCEHASVALVTGQAVSFHAATDPCAGKTDLVQVELAEGPSLDSVRTRATVVSQDVAADERWPRWGPAVSGQLGVGSAATFLLHLDDRAYGALNLYSNRPGGFDETALQAAGSLAGHAGIALATRREIDQLRNAVDGRTVIGQAQGLLMERLGLDAVQAFAYLKRSSSRGNRRLALVAADLVKTRRLPLSPPE